MGIVLSIVLSIKLVKAFLPQKPRRCNPAQVSLLALKHWIKMALTSAWLTRGNERPPDLLAIKKNI